VHSTGTCLGPFTEVRWNVKYYKYYNSRKVIEISEEAYKMYEELGNRYWGYIDWRGKFVPGLWQKELRDLSLYPIPEA
jgi:hypothetical protein